MKLVAHDGGRRWRGAQEMLGVIARGLRDRGHEVVVSCVRGSEVDRRFADRDVRTSGSRPRGDLDPFSAWGFARLLARERPDALLLNDWRRIAWAAWAGARADVPRVVARVGLPRELPPPGPRRWAMVRWVNRWYVPAEENRTTMVGSEPRLAGSVHVVPNGVEAPAAVSPAAVRSELGLPDGAALVVAAGAVAPRKGFDLLVRAVAEGPEGVHVAIAGDDDHADPEKALARELGVEDRVHFLGHRDDILEVFAAADLYVLSSRKEGSPPVLLEALLAGAPAVVATAVPGVPAILGLPPDAVAGSGPGWTRGDTGWLVRADHGPALAGALRDALDLREREPAAFRTLGDDARRRVKERFTVERMIDGVEEVLFG